MVKQDLLGGGSLPLEQPSSGDSQGPYAGYFQMPAENMDVHPGLPSCQLLISFALLFIIYLFLHYLLLLYANVFMFF